MIEFCPLTWCPSRELSFGSHDKEEVTRIVSPLCGKLVKKLNRGHEHSFTSLWQAHSKMKQKALSIVFPLCNKLVKK
jgi:hypothetical protein